MPQQGWSMHGSCSRSGCGWLQGITHTRCSNAEVQIWHTTQWFNRDKLNNAGATLFEYTREEALDG
jgi:hypothetical protein